VIGDGVLVIDKPSGITSFAVIRRLKKWLGEEKIGHTGTLDPLATGVLPLCFNQATKLVPFLMEGDKEYEVTMKLGVETDTQDSTGKVIRETGMLRIDEDILLSTFKSFEGKIKQLPPMYSALKFRGKPLYKLARQGIDLKREEREVEIKSIQLKDVEPPNCSFTVCCSKGTYIRTLCADIGIKLSCGAHLVKLRRLRTGPFTLKDSISLEEAEMRSKAGLLQEKIIPLAEALPHFSPIVLGTNLLEKVRRGMNIFPLDLKTVFLPTVKTGEKVKILSPEGELLAVAELLMDTPIQDFSNGQGVFRLNRVFVTPGLTRKKMM
jgi:tRNA pseudouridine55 synthase